MEKDRVIELLIGGIFVNTYSTSLDGYSESQYYKTYPDYDGNNNYNGRYRGMDYHDTGRSYRTEGVFGNEISKYSVYVRNKESEGGYFTVKFNFKDGYGRTRTETVTKYINAHEDEKFSHRKIYDDNYRYWNYDVVSDSRVPSRHW